MTQSFFSYYHFSENDYNNYLIFQSVEIILLLRRYHKLNDNN